MFTKDQIVTIYTNARELVRRGNARAARAYVLLLLKDALAAYENSRTILLKAKTAVFLDRWIAVSRDLYDKGITDYVLECFGLPVAHAAAPKREKPSRKAPAPEPASVPEPAPAPKAAQTPSERDPVDIAGLIEDSRETQGWCAEVFERNKGAVVEISVAGNAQMRSGTGFILSEQGYLLTNDHVVYDEANGGYFSKITMNRSGERKRHKLEPLFSDRKADIALCRFDPTETEGLVCVKRIPDYAALMQGADCLVIGNAFGMGLAPFSGVVRFTKNAEGDLVYTAPSNPGDSGGPVFNRKGECIGINKSKTVSVNDSAADGYANATPMDTIEEFLSRWANCNNITF